MALAAVGFVLLICFLDDTGVIASIALVLGLLFGAAYVVGLGWHMAS